MIFVSNYQIVNRDLKRPRDDLELEKFGGQKIEMHSCTIWAHTDAGGGGHVAGADDKRVDHVYGEQRRGLALGHQVGHDALHEQEAEQHRHRQVDLVPRVRRQEHREEADHHDDYHGNHQVAVVIAFTNRIIDSIVILSFLTSRI